MNIENVKQLEMFSKENVIKWIEIKELHSINWMHDNARKVYGDLCKLSNKDVLKVWQAIRESNYAFRRSIEPKGFVWSRHKHILHQIGSPEALDKIEIELSNRDLDIKYGIFMNIDKTEH